MIGTIKIRERGPTPRSMRKVWTASSRTAFADTGEHFHDHYRDRRFTHSHARAAGYKRRKGEGQPVGSKSRKRSYTGRKESRYGHSRPLEFSGKTRDKIETAYKVTSTSKKGRVAYRGARVFNFRPPKSQINMAEEFRRLLPEEEVQLGQHYDSRLDAEMDDSNWSGQAAVAS